MTQECEKILNSAERLHLEKLNSRVSYNSNDQDPHDMLREHQDNIQQFEEDLKQVQEDHNKNDDAWQKWQNEQTSLMASKDLQENIKNQIAAAKKVNESLTRMLADISKHVKNFRALNDVI